MANDSLVLGLSIWAWECVNSHKKDKGRVVEWVWYVYMGWGYNEQIRIVMYILGFRDLLDI